MWRSSSLPRAFWWLWAGALVNALCTFVFPFLALFLTARGFSVSTAGLMAAAYGAGSVLSGPVSGFAADRFGRRPILLLSLALSATFTALLPTLSSHWAIGSVVLALGLAWAAYRPTASAVVADVVPPTERARAFAWIYWANNLGMAISLVGGGTLAALGYRTLFLADAATTLLFLLIAAWRIPETRAPTVQAGAKPGGVGPVLRDHHFVLFLAVNLLFILPFFQFQVSLPVDMAQHGLGPQGFGLALAVNGLLIALLQLAAGRVLPRFEPALVLCLACVLVAAGYGAYTFCRTVPEYALATGVWTLGEILYFPVASALVASLAPQGWQGRYQGLFSMSFGIGMTLAPLTGPQLMEHFGAPVLWRSCFGVGLLVAFAELVMSPSRETSGKGFVMASIIRSWRASAKIANAPAYERHLRENVVPQLRRIPGFLGVTLLRRDRGDRAELQVLTRWKSMDAIRKFAGEDPEGAVVEPEAQAVLLEFDSRVTHFDVVFTSDEGPA